MFQGLGTQVLSCCCWQGPDEASGSHWRLGKTELLGFSFVLGSAHPLRPNSQPSLYGGRETGKSTDTQKSWDKPMTVKESRWMRISSLGENLPYPMPVNRGK